MPQYLVQARKNGNVIKSIVASNPAEVAAVLRETADLIQKTADPELIQSLSFGVRQVPDGKQPIQYHGVVLFTIDPNQADTDNPPTLEAVTGYLEDAVRTDLDCAEHGNEFGFANPVLLADTIVPATFKLPEVDATLVCDYFRRKGYLPDTVCYYQGEKWRIVGFPFPTEEGVAVCIRHAEDSAYVKQPDILLVSLLPQ